MIIALSILKNYCHLTLIWKIWVLLTPYLGLIYIDSMMYMVSQSLYLEKILNKFNLLFENIFRVPYNPSLKLGINNARCVSQLEYSQVIESLMHAMHCTRSDIAFVVGKLSRYTSWPSSKHWKAISIVLGYLKVI